MGYKNNLAADVLVLGVVSLNPYFHSMPNSNSAKKTGLFMTRTRKKLTCCKTKLHIFEEVSVGLKKAYHCFGLSFTTNQSVDWAYQ